MFSRPIKSALFLAAAIFVGLLVAANTDARFWPPPEPVKSPTGAVASSCQGPVELAPFIRGLDYQDETLVYLRGKLKCSPKGMSVIFKVSDIAELYVIRVTREMIEEANPGLPPNAPEWGRVGSSVFLATLKHQPLGPMLRGRTINGKKIGGIGIDLEEVVSRPDEPLPLVIQAVAKAYQERTSATIWARVKWTGMNAGTGVALPGGVIVLDILILDLGG